MKEVEVKSARFLLMLYEIRTVLGGGRQRNDGEESGLKAEP